MKTPPHQNSGIATDNIQTPNATTHLVVEPDDAGQRLDRFLQKKLPNLPHGQIQKLLRTGQVRLDSKRTSGEVRVAAWQSVRVPPSMLQPAAPAAAGAKPAVKFKPPPSAARTAQLKKYVIYEDKDLVVLNKPAGLAVQGGTGIKRALDDELMVFALGSDKPKLVHRLDRETSGVLVVARTDYAARALSAAFRTRAAQKFYVALVAGVPAAPSGTIQAPLAKGRDGVVRVTEVGQSAVSDFYVIDHAHKKATALLLKPHTGRTHQLRVHCQYLGCPILGDKTYMDEAAEELTAELGITTLHLHALALHVPHPRGGVLQVEAPLPPAQATAWQALGFHSKLNLKKLLAEIDI